MGVGNDIKGQIRNPELRSILRGEGLRQVAFMPIAADDDWFLTTTNFGGALNEADTVTSFTLAYCPGFPVCPVTVITDAAADNWTGVAVITAGIDQFGDYITDSVAATNSSGTWTATHVKAFQTLTSVTITVAGTTTASDSYIIGFAKTYGLGCRIAASGDVSVKMFDGAADAGTTSVANCTYVVAGTPDAAKNLILLIRPTYYLGKA